MKRAIVLSIFIFLLSFFTSVLEVDVHATTSNDVWQNSNSNYFEVIEEKTPIYINVNGKLVQVGELKKGQVFPRIRDYGSNWHEIQFSDSTAYVRKSKTLPSTKSNVTGENTRYSTSKITINAQRDIKVYDNSSGALVEIGTISRGQDYRIVQDYGNWWRIIFSDRVGYISKSDTTSYCTNSDKYFRVDVENVPVYDNRSGSLKEIGELQKGQIYKRISDYGNWHRIQVGNYYGYVWKDSTSLALVNSVAGENNRYTNSNRNITVTNDAPVYDNSSGSLVQIGTLDKGVKVTIVQDYGNWWRILLGDRVGYINKSNTRLEFIMHDEYFKVLNDNTPIYDNRSGRLVQIGELERGQVFPRVSDYGNWHRVQFGDYYGYVNKQNTTALTNTIAQNEIGNVSLDSRKLIALTDTIVYDNSNSTLTPIGTITEGTEIKPIRRYGSNWWEINYLNRKAYVSSSFVKSSFLPGDKYFKVHGNANIYDNRTGKLVKVGEAVDGQAFEIVSSYGNWWRINYGDFYGYIRKNNTGYASLTEIKNLNTNYNNTNKRFRTLDNIEVYDNSSGSLVPFAILAEGLTYPIVSDYGSNWYRILVGNRVGYVRKSSVELIGITYTNYNLDFNRMVDIQMAQGDPKYDGQGRISADRPNVIYYLNPSNTPEGTREFLQFLILDRVSGLTANEINNAFLKDKGILSGTGSAFIEAGNRYDVNELYLIAHALHETGHGTSALARGIGVDSSGRVQRDSEGNIIRDINHEKVDYIVYNMYGYGAYDSNPIDGGAKFAFDKGWTSPEKAIIGGAEQIVNSYIAGGQNTLYKMKWDPEYAANENSRGKQYATHIMWAVIQARSLFSMLGESIHQFSLEYDVPVYKNQPRANNSVPPAPGTNVTEYPNPIDGEVTATTNLNLREGPGTNYDLIDSIPSKSIVLVLGHNNGNWYKVKYNGQEGWVSGDYLKLLN